MLQIVAIDRNGNERSIEAPPGITLMEAIRNEGMDELLAQCGGCCSCATCHVFIEQSGEGVIPQMSDDETDLLDSSDHRKPQSRLSCQIRLTSEMSGLRVAIAPED
ncbi:MULTISPECIES: 2Fe-2S iron-sulfur cluster-binding protein [Rhizobium]|uniref:2Fe-2S iron-sulfur cluster-binding protein n=1 Tax=Rhizobium phaseoli TaxID=396 RepID=UPI000190491E|nr:2Fe-2S iron-sulfur cluster-binding protein [Rhizobium phaseoli]ARM16141.1 2Fe-2S ferredoxin-like protein [Rhizobium phaseoli Brasil 5]